MPTTRRPGLAAESGALAWLVLMAALLSSCSVKINIEDDCWPTTSATHSFRVDKPASDAYVQQTLSRIEQGRARMEALEAELLTEGFMASNEVTSSLGRQVWLVGEHEVLGEVEAVLWTSNTFEAFGFQPDSADPLKNDKAHFGGRFKACVEDGNEGWWQNLERRLSETVSGTPSTHPSDSRWH